MTPVLFKSRAAVVALAIALCALGGCGGGHKLVGKWQMSGAPVVWEFFSNGAARIGEVNGRYRLNRDRLKVEQGFATAVYQMEFSGDRLILRDSNNSKLEFTRVKK